MLIELIITAFVAAYVAIVALGHVLLMAAIYECPREDGSGGRGRMTAVRPRIAAATPVNRTQGADAIIAGSVSTRTPRSNTCRAGKRPSLVSA